MALLQETTLIASTTLPNTPTSHLSNLRDATRSLRKAASFANVYEAARRPLKTIIEVRNAVEGWRSGLTKEEREQQIQLEAKKTLRYFQQRNVLRATPFNDSVLNIYRLLHWTSGKLHRQTLIFWRITMLGRKKRLRQITMCWSCASIWML